MTLSNFKSLVKELLPRMKILLFGHRGQVGSAVEKRFQPHSNILASTIDITDYKTVDTAIQIFRPDVIINCAAYTQVDDAECNKDKAFAVNAVAPHYMAHCAKNYNALLVHYSTDYVFDGMGQTPWTEDDTPSPINTYGSTKYEGDQQIIHSGCRYLILRTSWVYGDNGNNFITSILTQSQKKNNLSVVCDQIGSPSSASFLADATFHMIQSALINESLLGVYHIAPKGETSWADYARFIIKKAGLSLSVKITPVLSKDYPQTAKRPLNSRLDTTKLQKAFSIIPPNWKQGVSEFLHHKDIINEL